MPPLPLPLPLLLLLLRVWGAAVLLLGRVLQCVVDTGVMPTATHHPTRHRSGTTRT